MSETTPATGSDRDPTTRRLIGTVRGDKPGPMLICIAGLHGNEPSGNHAVARVIERLGSEPQRLAGDLVGLTGNLEALNRSVRFIDDDMNRVWQPERVLAVLQALREGTDGAPMVGNAELGEQRALLEAIRKAVAHARGPVRILDLHTTSSESAPFTTLGDTLENRAMARSIPVPAVLGLEEQIDGAMLQYFDLLGWTGIGIEGGQHDAPESIDAHEDVVWVLLASLGMLEENTGIGLRERRARLETATVRLPSVVDVRYRQAITDDDEFRMDAGFRNFASVRKGQRLGRDRHGAVRAPMAGLLFLPLYQKQGDDGFFIVRALHPAWLWLSAWLRKRGIDRYAAWIPGVIAHPDRGDAVVLASWATNRAVVGVLHLLGFNARHEGDQAVMIRRVESNARGSALDLRQ